MCQNNEHKKCIITPVKEAGIVDSGVEQWPNNNLAWSFDHIISPTT